jgi:hypothetical protein
MAEDDVLGEHTNGVWSAAQARACGLTDAEVRARLARGEWQRLRRGVYSDGGTTPDAVQRARAALLATGPGAVVAGRTLVRLLGLPLIDDDDPVTGAAQAGLDDVAVPATAHPRRRPTLHVERLQLRPGDLMSVRRCPALALERALPGLAAVLTPAALVCVLDAALHEGRTEPERLSELVIAMRGRRNASALRRAVALADGRAESPAETLCRLLLLPVLPGLVPQVEAFDHAARPVARFDLADEGLRLAIEVDGRRGHAGTEMVARDRRRDARTRALGWETERCTWWELRREPDQLRRRILERAGQLRTRRAA